MKIRLYVRRGIAMVLLMFIYAFVSIGCTDTTGSAGAVAVFDGNSRCRYCNAKITNDDIDKLHEHGNGICGPEIDFVDNSTHLCNYCGKPYVYNAQNSHGEGVCVYQCAGATGHRVPTDGDHSQCEICGDWLCKGSHGDGVCGTLESTVEPTPTATPTPIELPNLLWNSMQMAHLNLSGLYIEDIDVEVIGTTFTEYMVFEASVYYKNEDGTKGEKIGDYADVKAPEAQFVLPQGVEYEDIVVEYKYAAGSKEVPNVMGKKLETAVEILADAGFTADIRYALSNLAENGYVYSQYNIGDKLVKGTAITIFVSIGREPAIAESINYTATVKSGEARLASLEVISDSENWIWEFAPDVYEYELYYSEGVSDLVFEIKATAKSGKATVNCPSTFVFSDENTVLEITVTAENGTKKVYTVRPKVY